MGNIAFGLIVAITLGSALMVVTSKQLLYSAIALLFTLFGVAGLYIFMWADFMAGVQVIVYIGGILVLLIFGIMLTNKISSVNISHTSLQRGVGAVITLGVLGFLIPMINNTAWLQLPSEEPNQTADSIGRLLMMDYLLPFEVASLLLLGALIGAAMLSRNTN
ncbi:MAG: NADH-quinone oxidoreductase subunit J [Candidatus Neomarinimicrobiota bacterium]|jgi:NADH-quinone oxidoreductase subunit J|nr:NADH-quinone oxidoreductase subunit J [Candidatus Neomarinimicrobiota bacterium]MEC7934649.1 NADH-quinone oxidoreductase subunit J [Candidatus Neomarinimicrobiota bacterium]MEC9026523.1 NADH-quinone oxidoreductase subunit J [Candidatus Neomarinimicrobiota bacterium]MEC9106425.1 NADH-quinone oxidoreductase subunit J [Candidatus Neomarinimicrobiota bacterium]MED5256251.1 NADH-quinone oxidoreductase subunit J [Candidatus Neomarinimicrobiota bacterium]|tara:strand:- start:2557 stop:3045 length:489 start_codon:yes stop_codon:yes gene_type:complete